MLHLLVQTLRNAPCMLHTANEQSHVPDRTLHVVKHHTRHREAISPIVCAAVGKLSQTVHDVGMTLHIGKRPMQNDDRTLHHV